ncbi:aspartyl-tRNA(Asn)/glutamyl-tRNA(Gln) amidotransferase subunit A [Rhodovulum sp. ES.010]|uniref:amidase n=1 Tax=Rhodovulum sp. ES.010 TaxID=1882821 RepID=UPI00092B3B7F|nr:amidase family protein [Rhodovulum sp. ES.010]SIO48076.1 aspartyl-tRNA(Asn)/glutamyl-tRNA(Gln) amidotransferase subunit A [Rhodovulum sp. ES.010]
MASDWRRMSAGALGRGIGSGEIDPVDLTAAFLDAIAAHEHGDRIYARVTRDRALSEAEAARTRARLGLRRGPIDGVPISWKDLFDSAGVATEAGSSLLKGRVPGRDAEVLANATACGLVCLGKTHMTELAFSGLGLNPVTETPPCVNDPDAAPGGSSSGAATSVAFGLAAGGIGSDTGGSVRVPAAWNDLVGLKTGAGRVSLAGVVPLAPRFDTVGPLTRTVEDAALLLAALEGGQPADLRGATLKGARLMVLDTVAFDDIREAPKTGFESAVDRLGRAGATVVRADIPEVSEAMTLSGVLYATEAYATWSDAIEAAPEKMFPEVLKRFRGGRDFSGMDYVAASQKLDRLRLGYAARVAGFDAVLVPTVPILPPNTAALLADADLFVSENLMTLRNTRIGNLMGLAVLTLPTGVPSAGISLMGPAGSEERLLRLGAAAEAALA